MEKRYQAKNETFWQRMTLPVEECLRYGITKPVGTYRWFASPNVVAIEHYRRRPAETKPSPPPPAA
jgi:hypothetical protein